MRYIAVIIIIFCLGFTANAQKLNDSVLHDEIRIGPFEIFFKGLEISYEKLFSEHSSIVFDSEIILDKTTSYLVEIQFRRYLLNFNDPTQSRLNYYVCPSFRYRFYELLNSKNGITYPGNDFIKCYSYSFNFGLKHFIGKSLTLDLNAGIGPKYSDIKDNSPMNSDYTNTFSLGYRGLAPVFNFTIGFRL